MFSCHILLLIFKTIRSIFERHLYLLYISQKEERVLHLVILLRFVVQGKLAAI